VEHLGHETHVVPQRLTHGEVAPGQRQEVLALGAAGSFQIRVIRVIRVIRGSRAAATASEASFVTISAATLLRSASLLSVDGVEVMGERLNS